MNDEMENDEFDFSSIPSPRPSHIKRLQLCKTKEELLLKYSPTQGDASFVDNNVDSDNDWDLSNSVYTFRKQDVKDFGDSDVSSRTFILGCLEHPEDEYFVIEGRKLRINQNVRIHKRVSVSLNWFASIYGKSKVSVFQKIAQLSKKDIVIGGSSEDAIPTDYWAKIVSLFPGKTEIEHYINSRLEGLLSDYLPMVKNNESLLRRYQKKRMATIQMGVSFPDKLWIEECKLEIEKFNNVYSKLKHMLEDQGAYELQWEEEIQRIICLIYPQYIHTEKQVQICVKNADFINKEMRFDLVLFDVAGHMDLIEIKRPSVGTVFRKGIDHGNNVPSLLFSQAVMQIEKYVMCLQRGGGELENKLRDKYDSELPEGVSVSIINPRGMLIFGRSNDFDTAQKSDFQVLRRQYAHLIEIITYDDLLARLAHIVEGLKRYLSI